MKVKDVSQVILAKAYVKDILDLIQSTTTLARTRSVTIDTDTVIN